VDLVAAPASTYDPSTNVGKVRLFIGDTDTGDAKFIDTEINVFITEAGSSKLRAAAGLALLTWAATLGRDDESVSVGAWSGDRRDVAEKMSKLAKEYLDMDNFALDKKPAPYWGVAAIDWTPDAEARRRLTED